MANLLRNAKSSSDWTSNDLKAYNIEVVQRGEREFFGSTADALPSGLDKCLLTYEFMCSKDVPDNTSDIISYLDLDISRQGGRDCGQ